MEKVIAAFHADNGHERQRSEAHRLSSSPGPAILVDRSLQPQQETAAHPS